MPLKELYTLSNIRACKGALGSPVGAGIRSMIADRISSIPMPLFPLASKMSSCLQPISSIIWSVTSGIMAPSISILLITGMISKLLSMARYKLLIVCACMPWLASTSSKAPSQAASARLTS